MGTSAIVYVLFDGAPKAIRVNSDGYPDYMIPSLTKIVEQGLLNEFVANPEYSYLASGEAYTRGVESFKDHYINVENIGFAFRQPIVLDMVLKNDGTVDYEAVESQSYPDHTYIIHDGGKPFSGDAVLSVSERHHW